MKIDIYTNFWQDLGSMHIVTTKHCLKINLSCGLCNSAIISFEVISPSGCHSIISSMLDYCNSVSVGISENLCSAGCSPL